MHPSRFVEELRLSESAMQNLLARKPIGQKNLRPMVMRIVRSRSGHLSETGHSMDGSCQPPSRFFPSAEMR